jgi:hypothetical protein
MAHLPSLPAKATLLDGFKAFPETNRPLLEFHEALLRGPSPFTEAEREMIATFGPERLPLLPRRANGDRRTSRRSARGGRQRCWPAMADMAAEGEVSPRN